MTSRFPTGRPKRPRGRPAKGLRPGELVTNYERVTVRMPAASKARLMALADVTTTPVWLLLTNAVDMLWEQQPADVRELAGKLAKRKAASYQAEAE